MMRSLAALPYRALRALLRVDQPVPSRTDQELAAEVERLARRKPVIVNLGLFTERLPLWGLIVAAMLATRSPLLAMTVFFVSYAGHAVGAGIVAPAWQELIARCFPVNPWEVPGATSAAVFWA